MKGKTIFTVLVLILLLAAIPVTIFLVKQQQEVRKRAAPATTLTLNSDKTQPSVNETFNVSVAVNTGPNQVIITEMYMTYDPAKVEAVDFVPGTFFSSPNTTGKSIDNTNGRVSLTVFLPTGTVPKSGTGVVATASFKAKAAGATTVRLTDATLVGAIAEGGKNVLTGSTPVTVTVKSTSTTLSPTPTGTATGSSSTPTRTPSPTGAGSSASPSPTGVNSSPTPTGIGSSASPSPTGLALSPTPTPVPDTSLLALTSPPSGATVTTNLPSLTGTAKAGATVTIAITGAITQTGVATADSTGIFSFSPTSELSEGAQSVTLTEQATDGSTRSSSSTFTVATSALPTTGVIENTILLVGIAFILLIFGVLLPYLPLLR